MLRICVLLLSWTCCLYLASALWAQPQPPAKNPGSEVMPGKAAPEKAMPDKTIPDKTIPDKTAPDKAAAGK
ncbi:MAG TPA: hypothetical protein PKA06_14535, partial [Gemmatales bacterium]|nr:hypothetical protein [Gemmatales bacterium]